MGDFVLVNRDLTSSSEQLLPAEFFLEHGIKLFDKKEYKESLDKFRKALRECPYGDELIETRTLISKIKTYETWALTRLTFYSWLYSEISSNEAISNLQKIFDDTEIDEEKSSIKNIHGQICGVQGLTSDLAGNLVEAKEFYNEAHDYSNDKLERRKWKKMIKYVDKRSLKRIETSELFKTFENFLIAQNKEVQNVCRKGEVLKAETMFQLLIKMSESFFNTFGEAVRLLGRLLETFILILKGWSKIKNAEMGEKFYQMMQRIFPHGREIIENASFCSKFDIGGNFSKSNVNITINHRNPDDLTPSMSSANQRNPLLLNPEIFTTHKGWLRLLPCCLCFN